MQRDRTDAMLRYGDNQPQVGVASRRHAVARTLAAPANVTTNIRATLWLIACLLAVWAVIVTT
jgi:hypothetical protein